MAFMTFSNALRRGQLLSHEENRQTNAEKGSLVCGPLPASILHLPTARKSWQADKQAGIYILKKDF